MTRLLLIRHPETHWNVDGRFQGQTDVPLNETGVRQAEALARTLADTKLDAVYTSDLQRARYAAELVAKATGAPLHVDRRLREIFQGTWEGMLGADVDAEWPELVALRRLAPLRFAPPGGEAFGDVQARVLGAIEDIMKAHPDGTVAVFSHGLSLAIVRVHFSRAPVADVWELIPPNGEVLRIEV